MSQISLKSISGITSITTPAGVDNQLTLHNYNTTEAVKLDVAGNLHFHNHLNISGISTASNFKTGTSNLHSTGLNIFDLDVDGHTNLDNVSIVGIATVTGSSQINFGSGTTQLQISNSNDSDINHNESNGSGMRFRINGQTQMVVKTDSITYGTNTHNYYTNRIAVHSGDSDTHISFPTNDTITFDTAGIERLRVTNTGVNVTGVLTATSFVGSGALLTGIVGGKFNGPAAGILTTSTVGIQTADVTSADLVGAATSMVGLYIGDGHLLFSNYLNKSGGYYITTGLNALNAGPVTLGSTMTLDGTWVIV